MVFTEGCTGNSSFVEVDMAICQRMQENRDDCWQNLVQQLLDQSAMNQRQYQHLETKYNQLVEQLADSEARNRALIEASAAQAQQFSQTLKQLHQNQSQIVQSEKMASLGQLVAGVAHEINNPVNFIYGNLSYVTQYIQDVMHLLQLYQQHYPAPDQAIVAAAATMDLDFLTEDLPKLIASMRMGTERIQKIVLSLRNFSRMDEAEMKTVDIHEGIESTLLILQNRLKAKSESSEIVVVKEYGDLPVVECYAGQLNQVIMNILVNAIDALEEAELKQITSITGNTFNQITISTSVIGSKWVQIVIADNGSGMREEVCQRIFDPFFTTKPVGKGTGLGLSISYQIITEKHSGRLECFSTLEVGTKFVIQIPVHQTIH